ncbi:MAG: proline--tRNA ligase [Marvinbryantia sp.]|jgi:prolyl-tRNA synthetase
MKLEKLVGDRFKERPSDCVIDSHAWMVRGGYMKYVANGIYSSYLPLRRITRKIEQIIREEMDKIDGQEVQFPVVMPASLWQESGRYESIGKELIRFSDRSGSPLVLGMTHEEAAVQLVREYGQSYSRYPFMIYQIQTKFRDEARPRAGLIRVREFTMKDAYSFHTSQADLEEYYQKCHKAYERIFARAGVPEVISVMSDSGMMGGNVSHEFMLLTPVGEDSIAICKECGYHANMEAAASIIEKVRDEQSEDLTLVHTPHMQTIEAVCSFLGSKAEKSCKAVVYQRNEDDKYIVLFLRGDLEVNETKVTNYLGCEIHPAVITEECGLHAGYIGPYNLQGNFIVLYDKSLEGINNLCCGANKEEYHYTGLDMTRDLAEAEYHDFAKITEGGICPQCGKPGITISRGIEVGNIFQLGKKYTESMNMTYVEADGVSISHPVMGCYGIGVGRLAAAVCEAHHDDFGPIWPMSIAPWQVHLCAVRPDEEAVKTYADKLYEELQDKGIEVIYDDRKVRAGVMFSDADLLGVPLRVVVSPRNMKEGVIELVSRDKTVAKKVALADAVEEIRENIYSMLDE